MRFQTTTEFAFTACQQDGKMMLYHPDWYANTIDLDDKPNCHADLEARELEEDMRVA